MKFKWEKHRLILELENGQEAFVAFGIDEGKRVMVVSTTYVPESMRGKGIAGKLSAELVRFAKEKGYKIYPLCSYTKKYLERKKLHDLIYEEDL